MDTIRQNPKCDREIAVYGYLRGTKMKGNARVHIAGVGDAMVSLCNNNSKLVHCLNTQAWLGNVVSPGSMVALSRGVC